MSRYQAIASSEDPEAWHAARRRSVTATDVARLAGGGPATWQAVKAEKAGHKTFAGNQYTEHGIAREPVIARWAEAELGMEHNTSFLVLAEDERFGATPDLLGPDDILVGDIKTAKAPEWAVPPSRYVDQLQWQMHITGAESAYLVVEFHEDFVPTHMEPTVYVVDRDEDRIRELIGIAESFLSMGEPSLLDLYLHDWTVAKEREDGAKADREEVEKLIRKEIGESSSFKHVSEAGSITLTTPKPAERFDSRRFKEVEPDIYAQFVTTSQGKPRLTIKGAA